MPADDGGAAAVALERAQLREKPRREQAGVAAMAVVGRADDAARVLPPVLHDAQDRLLPQKRLVGDHVEDPGAVRHGLGAEADGPADAVVRAVIPDGMKPGLLRLLQKRRILGNDGDAANVSAGIAASASENRLLPAKLAVSLFSPKRDAFPAAMMRQPMGAAVNSDIARLLVIFYKSV